MISNIIEAAYIEEVMKEQVLYFNIKLCHNIQKYSIQLENIYNIDETDI